MALALKDVLALIDDLLPLAGDVGNAAIEKETNLAGLGARFLARGAQAVYSASLLAQHGLNGDAMSVARTVTELAIDYPYIALDPNVRLRKFREWDHIAKYRLAVATAELHDGAFDPELMRSLRDLHDKALENYPGNARPLNWAGESIQRRAIVVDENATSVVRRRMRKRMYQLPYADMCDASHSCWGTLEYVLDEERELVFGRMSPDLKSADLAFIALLLLCGDVVEANSLDRALGERIGALCLRRHPDAAQQRA